MMTIAAETPSATPWFPACRPAPKCSPCHQLVQQWMDDAGSVGAGIDLALKLDPDIPCAVGGAAPWADS
jgi:hypothetical protein